MRMKRIRQAAGWLTVAMLASLTTVLSVIVLAVMTRRGHALGDLTTTMRGLIGVTLLLVALSPWWAMLVLLLQTDRKKQAVGAL